MNAALYHQARGLLKVNEPMSRHCSWRTGGNAESYFEPIDKEDLSLFLESLDNQIQITWIGLGSNLLVRDGGIKGVVIGSLGKLNQLKIIETDKAKLVYAECGVSCAQLARFCNKHELGSADFLAGIPGTVGGALAMNAGAFGSETWEFVKTAEMMNRKGEISKRDSNQFKVSYRTVGRKDDEWFSAAWFCFPERSSENGSKVKQLIEKRNLTQPIGEASCGSVFKNPDSDYAARLVEAVGLKGYCIEGACVSDKHANFIINTGAASATNIEDLIHEIQNKVEEKFSISLQTEVKIIGDAL